MNIDNEPVLTVAELATRWKIKPLTIYRRLESGEIKGFKVGSVWRIPMAAVVAFENGPKALGGVRI